MIHCRTPKMKKYWLSMVMISLPVFFSNHLVCNQKKTVRLTLNSTFIWMFLKKYAVWHQINGRSSASHFGARTSKYSPGLHISTSLCVFTMFHLSRNPPSVVDRSKKTTKTTRKKHCFGAPTTFRCPPK